MSGEGEDLTDDVRQNIATLATRVAILELGQEATMKALADIKTDAAAARGEQKEWRHQMSAQMALLISAADVRKGEEQAQARVWRIITIAVPFAAGIAALASIEWVQTIMQGASR